MACASGGRRLLCLSMLRSWSSSAYSEEANSGAAASKVAIPFYHQSQWMFLSWHPVFLPFCSPLYGHRAHWARPSRILESSSPDQDHRASSTFSAQRRMEDRIRLWGTRRPWGLLELAELLPHYCSLLFPHVVWAWADETRRNSVKVVVEASRSSAPNCSWCWMKQKARSCKTCGLGLALFGSRKV